MRNFSVYIFMVAATMLTACEMTSPSRMSLSPIMIEHQRRAALIPLDDFDAAAARGVADHYDRYGEGPVDVTVLYGAGLPSYRADAESRRIARLLENAGLSGVNVTSLPVNDYTKTGQVMIDYTMLTAKAPAECGAHPGDGREGINKEEAGLFEDYRFGCGVDKYMAAQVKRPRDLMGDTDIGTASVDHASARLQDYRQGRDFKELKGLNASELQTK